MQNIFFSLLSVVFNALSSLYQGIFGSRERKHGSLKGEFAIRKARYAERIYKIFARVKQREMDFGS